MLLQTQTWSFDTTQKAESSGLDPAKYLSTWAAEEMKCMFKYLARSGPKH